MENGQSEGEIRPSNLAEVVELMREIAEAEGGEFDSKAVKEWFSKSDRFLAATFQEKVVGAVSFSTNGIENTEMPILDFVNVLRPFQRRGIATRLCIAAIDELVRDGFTPIHCSAVTPASHKFVMSLPEDRRAHLRIEKAF